MALLIRKDLLPGSQHPSKADASNRSGLAETDELLIAPVVGGRQSPLRASLLENLPEVRGGGGLGVHPWPQPVSEPSLSRLLAG